VWDLRNFRLLQSASESLDGAKVLYDHSGDVIFSLIEPSSSAYHEPKLAPYKVYFALYFFGFAQQKKSD